jgi:hypothetical protein
MCSTQNLSRLLQCVFDLAGSKKSSGGRVLVLVLIVLVDEAEFVIVANSCAESANRSSKELVISLAASWSKLTVAELFSRH